MVDESLVANLCREEKLTATRKVNLGQVLQCAQILSCHCKRQSLCMIQGRRGRSCYWINVVGVGVYAKAPVWPNAVILKIRQRL